MANFHLSGADGAESREKRLVLLDLGKGTIGITQLYVLGSALHVASSDVQELRLQGAIPVVQAA